MVKSLEEKLGIVNQYLGLAELKRRAEQNPYDPYLREQLGISYGKKDLYKGVPPDAVIKGYDSILITYGNILREKVFYNDLIKGIPEPEKLVRILEKLPPLKGDEEIGGLHKKLLEERKIFEELINLGKENPEELKERISARYGGDEGLKYLISCGSEYAIRVAAIPLTIAREKLYEAIKSKLN